MHIKTILNRVKKYKSFVYGQDTWLDTGGVPELEVEMKHRSNSQPICSVCGCKASGYDHLPVRRFEFIPMSWIKVFFRYTPRRVNCPRCGIRVEEMPWSKGKRQLTETGRASIKGFGVSKGM